MAGARRQHDHVARSRRRDDARLAAELHRDLGLVYAEHLVRIAVEVVKWEHAVAPGGGPAVARKQLFERFRGCRLHRIGVNEQRPARMVRDVPRRRQVRDEFHASAAATASPKARVPSLPPRSAVRFSGLLRVWSTAAIMARAASPAFWMPFFSASHSRSIAADRMSEVGFAWSLPAMS